MSENKIFIRRSSNFQLVYDLEQYAKSINKCIPVITELGLMPDNDYKQLIRYCCNGGRERLKKDFLKDLPESSAFYKVANRQFDVIMSSHPEYSECANKWKWVNLLKLENGQVVVNNSVVDEYQDIYLTDPIAIDKYKHIEKLCDELNYILKDCENKCTYLHRLFYFDTDEHKYMPAKAYLSNEFFYRMNLYSLDIERSSKSALDQWNKFINEQAERDNKIEADNIKNFGLKSK